MTMIMSKILVFLEPFCLYSDCRGYNTLPPSTLPDASGIVVI